MTSVELDNPVWNSLNETHERFCLDYEGIKFYNPAYCTFGGTTDRQLAVQSITAYAQLTPAFFIVGDRPIVSDAIEIKRELVCNQMLLESKINLQLTEDIIELKTAKQKQELFELISLVQPGYFRQKTAELGRYFGIYKDAQLIAVTGERMQTNSFTELSGIVTHPQHTRKGYARQLIKHTTDLIFTENKLPYLHVLSSNASAIKLYDSLGFKTRRKMSFWQLRNRST